MTKKKGQSIKDIIKVVRGKGQIKKDHIKKNQLVKRKKEQIKKE